MLGKTVLSAALACSAIGLAGCHSRSGGGAAATSGTGGLPDGDYDCSTMGGSYDHPMVTPAGHFDIDGATYRFRPLGNVTDGYSPYSVASDGSISWGGPVGDLNKPPQQILSSKKEDWGFNVNFKLSEGEPSTVMSCRLVKS